MSLHTLLPDREKKALQSEYRARALIVFCSVISSAIIVGIVFLLPAYLNARNKEQAALRDISSLQNAAGRNSTTTAELAEDSALLSLTNASPSSLGMRRTVSSFVADIIALRGSVSLDAISIDNSSTSTVSIVIQGVASSRNDLLSLKQRILNASPSAKVDLPISGLVKSRDIQFSMKIIEPLP